MNGSLVLTVSIVFSAAFVKGMRGFGFVVVWVPLLSLLFSHIATGLTDMGVLITFAKLLPFLFLGVYMGHRLFGYIAADTFKKIILVFLVLFQ